MSRCIELASACLGATALCLTLAAPAAAQQSFPGIGRAATPAEIAAWDIDVRPDFKGLPKGSGTVARGQKVWDEKCASCHGTFGESNEVFPPIVGGTTAEDIQRGRVKALTEPVGRTTLMKLSSLSALWDYINRAMPWDRPKSLSTDEVYAVVAYILHLGDILPGDFVLSDATIRQAEQRLPNRNGKVKYEPLWNLKGKGDVTNVACMKDCPVGAILASYLPDYARDAHGNLALQTRAVGPTRGVDTSAPSLNAPPPPPTDPALALANRHSCMACHRMEGKHVGPAFKDVAARYAGKPDAAAVLAAKVKSGGAGNWGQIPMPPNTGLSDQDLAVLVKWILSGGS
ncbi:MAG: c-type cytochrome [Betaproteobacteria bacterium]|nr:c-type cytochrome [Betaproteobacteria bacterium]